MASELTNPLNVDRDIVIPPDALYTMEMPSRVREVLEYLQNSGDLSLYVGVFMSYSRLKGVDVDPVQALEHAVSVLSHRPINSSPVRGDFEKGSHRGALRRLHQLVDPKPKERESNKQDVALGLGRDVHSLVLGWLQGDTPGIQTGSISHKHESAQEDSHIASLSLADCIDGNGRVKRSVLSQIAEKDLAVIEALSRGPSGMWDAQSRGEELYVALKPLLGEYGVRIHKHHAKHSEFVAPTLANLATLVLFTQSDTYQESRLPMFTEIPPLLDKLSGRADAFVVTGIDGRPLTEKERQSVEKIVRDRNFCKGRRSIGNVIQALSEQLGGQVEGMIIDLKNAAGDHPLQNQLINEQALTNGAFPAHVIQVTNYSALANLEAALLARRVTHAHIWPEEMPVGEAHLWYLLDGDIKVETIAPAPIQLQEHFRERIAQPYPTARRQAELREMLNYLVWEVAHQAEDMRSGKSRKLYPKPASHTQDDLFGSVTFRDVIEAHRVFTDETRRVEIIGYESNGKPKYLVHWNAVIRDREERMANNEVLHDNFTTEKGGMMRCLFPDHEDNGPSCRVTKEGVYCFGIGCHQHAPVYVEDEEMTGGEGVGLRRRKRGKKVSVLSEDLHEIQLSDEQIAIMGVAQELFRATFDHSTLGKSARTYIEGRSISLETAKEFGAGYCNFAPSRFIEYFEKRGFSREQLIKYNLLAESKKRKGEYYLPLNKRITFPLALQNDTTNSFYGRSIDLDAKVKHYMLNIRDHDLPPHGMGHQKVLIARPKKVTVTEGVFDAMARYEMGDHTVIPIIATSNNDLLQLIARGVAEDATINLALDYDTNQSGQSGTRRIKEALDELGFRRNGGKIHDVTRIYMRYNPEDTQYKDWNLIWQAHPGMQVNV